MVATAPASPPLLRALAERRIPGVASNLRVLLLGQTRITSDV